MAAIALHFMYYNFARIHQTTRVTPAMAAGVTKSSGTCLTLLRYLTRQIHVQISLVLRAQKGQQELLLFGLLPSQVHGKGAIRKSHVVHMRVTAFVMNQGVYKTNVHELVPRIQVDDAI